MTIAVAATERFLCPACRHPVAQDVPCAACGFRLVVTGGILRGLAPDRRDHYERFLREYAQIRRAEGRGSEDRAWYLALPYQDLTGRHSDQWTIRAASYRYFESRLLGTEPLDTLDLGAGVGWLSHRLSERRHRPVAVDILTEPLDGLEAAVRHYGSFPAVEAEFDRLPFAGAQFDLAVFNSSLHYSTDYRRTLLEARRCLRPSGRIVVLDSPIYKQRQHGEQMREERHRQFEAQHGFRSDSVPSIEYLYESQLDDFARDLGLRWEIHRPWYGWSWHLRPWKARLLGRRPPSRFWILVGSFAAA